MKLRTSRGSYGADMQRAGRGRRNRTVLSVLLLGLAVLVARQPPIARARDPIQPNDTPKITAPPTPEPAETEPPTPVPWPSSVPTARPTNTSPPPTASPVRPTSGPPPTADGPTFAPPTSPPQATLPVPPTSAVPSEEQASAVPATVVPSVGAISPTRTRRPTRTPKTTATLTPMPLVAGAMRITLAAVPAQPVLGESASFSVELANRGQGAVNDVTLDVTLPSDIVLERVEAVTGQTTQLDSLVRWHVERLASGGQSTLRLHCNVPPMASRELELCVILLSSGAPLEHCVVFETAGGSVTQEAGAGFAEPALPTAEIAGAVILESGTGGVLGWFMLLAGLVVLAAWIGLRLVAGREPAAEDV